MLKTKGESKSILDSSSSSSSEEASDNEEGLLKKAGKRHGMSSPKSKSKTGKMEKEDGMLTINKGYAERYNSWRNLEEMQKCKFR